MLLLLGGQVCLRGLFAWCRQSCLDGQTTTASSNLRLVSKLLFRIV